jgi:hypothetical protein
VIGGPPLGIQMSRVVPDGRHRSLIHGGRAEWTMSHMSDWTCTSLPSRNARTKRCATWCGRERRQGGCYHGLRRKHIDTYLNEFVFRYNRRFYRQVSFETMLGLASHHHSTSYWDIVGRDNPRKGVPTVRRQPRRRRQRPACGQADQDLPKSRTQPRCRFDPSALDIVALEKFVDIGDGGLKSAKILPRSSGGALLWTMVGWTRSP